jgi:hypothetical protein
MVLHHQLFEQPSCCACPCICFWQCAYIALCSHRVPPAMLTFSRACLVIAYCLMLSRHPSGNAQILTSSPCDWVSPHALAVSLQHCLHSHGQVNSPSTAQTVVTIVGLPLLPYFFRLPPNSPFVVIVGLPLSPYSLGLPLNAPVVVVIGLPSLPYSLELPPNAPFVVVIGRLSLPCSLLCDHCFLHTLLTPIPYFVCLVCCFLLSPCLVLPL